MKEPLRKVTLYLSAEEYGAVMTLAEDEGVSVGAILRAQLGLEYKRRGAPQGNMNRRARVSGRARDGAEEVPKEPRG